MASGGTIYVETASEAVSWLVVMQELNTQTGIGGSLYGGRLSKAAPRSWWGLCFKDSCGRARSHHVFLDVAGDERLGETRVQEGNATELGGSKATVDLGHGCKRRMVH